MIVKSDRGFINMDHVTYVITEANKVEFFFSSDTHSCFINTTSLDVSLILMNQIYSALENGDKFCNLISKQADATKERNT